MRSMLRFGSLRRLWQMLAVLALAAILATPVFATVVMAASAPPCHEGAESGSAAIPQPAEAPMKAHPCCTLVCLMAVPAAQEPLPVALDFGAVWDAAQVPPLVGRVPGNPDPPPRHFS